MDFLHYFHPYDYFSKRCKALPIGVSFTAEIQFGLVTHANEKFRTRRARFVPRHESVPSSWRSPVCCLELRDLDQETFLAEQQVEVRRQSLALARARFEGGLTSELDVRQGESALANAEGIVASLRRQRTQKENEISVLLGRAPGSIPRGLALGDQTFPSVIPAGLPSDLLQRRADVRQAEEELRAANAQIGAAIAALFPTISLTARGGTVSDDLGSLFSTGTGFWNLSANLLQPLINRGRNLKQVAAERARTEAAVAQ